ncbi:MAG: glycerate kinase [Rhodospirillales bacterium]|nr:glycerate kinase [Rhodospirillales bacterium]
MDPRLFLLSLFDAAVAAAQPAIRMPLFLPRRPEGRLVVVGAGKASAAMARAFEDAWDGPLSGLVVTRYGHGVPCRQIEIVEAAHPVPDGAGMEAAGRMLETVRGLGPGDLVVALMSGGGSAVLSLPAAPVALDEFRALTSALLKSGANIVEMNAVRKHLSSISGGRLAQAAAPARVLTLAISDVPGDDASTIGSGPTVADPTTLADARAVLAKYAISPSPAIATRLSDPASETPKALPNAEFRLIAAPIQSLDAAARLAKDAGFAVHSLGPDLEGESREVAAAHAALVRAIRAGTGPVRAPCVLLSGGETTVTVRGNGRGGRNAEFALALAVSLDAMPGIWAIAGDTDGIDGTQDNAGAIVTPDTLARARAKGLDATARLADNDGYGFFASLDDLVVTGPTHTNVNDFRAIVVT